MAFQIDMPILIFREKGVIADGILERGVVGSYMPEFDLNLSIDNYFKSPEWNQLINDWKKVVLEYEKNKQFKSDKIINHIISCSICEDKEISPQELYNAFKKSINSEGSTFSRFTNLIEADEAFKNRYEIKGCSMESDYETICQKFFDLQNLSKDHDKKKQDTANQEDQIHEPYRWAIDQLGSENIIVRLGAISELEKIADKSADKDYWQIMEILTNFVRINSPVKDWDSKIQELKNPRCEYLNDECKVRVDIQAVINVIGRRKYFFGAGEQKPLYLRNTNLRMISLYDALNGAHIIGADLKGAHLERAFLDFSDLIGATFIGAYLENAYFTNSCLNWAQFNYARLKGTHFERCYLKYANFSNADLSDAHLEGANLFGAHLDGAILKGAHLERADLDGAFLTRADLEKANLKGANFDETGLEKAILKGTNLDGASLEKANLESADLIGARNLTVDQLSEAKTLYYAKLDDELLIPLKTKYPHLFEKPE